MGKCKIDNILETASRRAKGVKIGTREVFRKYIYNIWHFGKWPSFMPKYGNYENQPISRKLLPVEWK